MRDVPLFTSALALFMLAAACRSGSGTTALSVRSAQVDWSEPVQIDSGGGHRGPWRMNESEYDYVDDPTLAVGARGHVAVAWVDQAQKDVLFQTFDRNRRPRFEAPVNVSRTPRTFSWLPRMVLTGADEREIGLLWQEIIFSGGSHGGEILFARSTDAGRSFSEPVNLSNSTGGDGKGRLAREQWDNGSLDLAVGPQKRLYAAWTEYDGALWLARSIDAGATFSQPLHVAGTPQSPARGPALAVAPDGKVHLAWAVGEDSAADIHWATSPDGGATFSEPALAWRSKGHSDAPKLAVDPSGRAHLVFAEGELGSGRYRIRYARAGSDRTFEAPHDDLGSGRYPTIALDGGGRIYVLWELYPEPEERPRGLGFSMSRDGGQNFEAPTVVPGTSPAAGTVNGGQQGLLTRKLSVGTDGLIAAVHSTFRENHVSETWLITGKLR